MPIETPALASHPDRAVRATLCIVALLLAIVASGCSTLRSDKLSYARLALPYDRTQLKSTTSLDALNLAREPAYQFTPREAEPVLLTQSDTAVAFSGRSADDRKTWLNLIVFDEFRMTAGRKYFFCIDEQVAGKEQRPRSTRRTTKTGVTQTAGSAAPEPRPPVFSAHRGLLFDGECLIHPDVLTIPYATEEAQKIAIVRWLAERFQNDVATLVGSPRAPTQGNRQITVSGSMVNQVFQGIISELAQSPGLAKNLATEQGVPFPHASLGEGRLRLLIQKDTAVLTIRINLPLPPTDEF